MRNQSAIILAAGRGSRMKSRTPKVLHRVGDVPMIVRVIQSALDAGVSNITIVVGYKAATVRATVMEYLPNAELKWVIQFEQKGTAHAVRCAEPALSKFSGDVWILSGDVPLISSGLIQDIGETHPNAEFIVTGLELDEPGAYGRLLRSSEGNLVAIREYVSCTPDEVAVTEVNAGLYRVDSNVLFEGLRSVQSNNVQSEYYLTDLVGYAALHKIPIVCEIVRERALELLGVNTVADLERANAIIPLSET